MKIRFLLFMIALLPFMNCLSQPAETIYQGNVIKTSYSNNESFGPFNIGFSFNFHGAEYNQLYVSSNGFISFDSGSTDPGEDPIPSAETPNNIIAPFWDDLVIDNSGSILYRTIGAAGNRFTIIQFRNMGFYSGPVYLGTFSVILYETSNIIQFQYRNIILPESATAHGAGATIGIENADGSAGTQYAHHNPSAISPSKAISFTPSGGSSYTMNTDASYEAVYLTTNLTLPEPGIPVLISPANEGVVGTSHTFTWNASPNTENYSFRISRYPNLGSATVTNTGTLTQATVADLVPGNTYYWGVFATNATGTTWCEIRKFTVSSTPPLAALPATFWTQQSRDSVIILNYTGGDASGKVAKITSLPAQGQLFQYNAGSKGAQITSVPGSVTDPNRRIFYSAPPSSGNGIGSFDFLMHDFTGDSPEAKITVNVSPDGIPNVMYVAKGTGVEIQFDREMSNPAGKHSQFTVRVNGSPATLTSAALKDGDATTLVLTPDIPLAGSETVSVSYARGEVTSKQGGFLASFTDQPVTLQWQTISFTQEFTHQFHLSPLTLNASSSGSLPLTYSSSNLGVATISGNTATFRSTGKTAVTARQAGNSTYSPARFTREFTITRGDQAISFPALPGKESGDPDFGPGASASSGLPVSYSSSNPPVATIVDNMIHITGAGTTVITASQPGNSNYNPAADVQQELFVSPATGIEDPGSVNEGFNVYRQFGNIIIEQAGEFWNGRTVTITVYDMTGSRVQNLARVKIQPDTRLEIPAPSEKGLYLVEIRAGSKRFTRKIVL